MAKPRVAMNLDVRQFNLALKQYVEHSRLSVSQAVTKQAINFAFRGNKRTQTANKGKFPDLSSGLFNAIAAVNSGSGTFGETASLAQKKHLGGNIGKGRGKAKAAKKLRSRRTGAANYSKALWLKLAVQLGATSIRTVKVKQIKNADAEKAKGTRFSDKPKATLHVWGIEEDHLRDVMEPAAQAALGDTVQDMRVYIRRQMAKLAQKHSGRKLRR